MSTNRPVLVLAFSSLSGTRFLALWTSSKQITPPAPAPPSQATSWPSREFRGVSAPTSSSSGWLFCPKVDLLSAAFGSKTRSKVTVKGGCMFWSCFRESTPNRRSPFLRKTAPELSPNSWTVCMQRSWLSMMLRSCWRTAGVFTGAATSCRRSPVRTRREYVRKMTPSPSTPRCLTSSWFASEPGLSRAPLGGSLRRGTQGMSAPRSLRSRTASW
mmetsp:Transcript_7469/g.20166  ORF Transcript_7469/g.20166 Transcript_7469/m.20166 type:complete len:215 (-) Transcript_7469:1149-1793(-)